MRRFSAYAIGFVIGTKVTLPRAFERAAFDFGDYTTNAVHAREFVAVHRAKNQDALAGFNGGEGNGLEWKHGVIQIRRAKRGLPGFRPSPE